MCLFAYEFIDIYICIYIYIHIYTCCIQNVPVLLLLNRLNPHTEGLYVYICKNTNINVSTYMFICLYIYTYIYMYKYVNILNKYYIQNVPVLLLLDGLNPHTEGLCTILLNRKQHTFIYIYKYTYMHRYIYICSCIYIYIYIHLFIYI
jgi:hypothetical protein